MATFKELVEAVEDNNNINNAQWSDWPSPFEIEEVYGQLDEDECDLLLKAAGMLTQAILSNGKSLHKDVLTYEKAVNGQNFAGSWAERISQKYGE